MKHWRPKSNETGWTRNQDQGLDDGGVSSRHSLERARGEEDEGKSKGKEKVAVEADAAAEWITASKRWVVV